MYTLDTISNNKTVMIRRLKGKGPTKRRLAEMGLTPETMITVKRIAPLGDPIEVALRGYELSLRKSDAQLIEITL